jgi:hypothetical protein
MFSVDKSYIRVVDNLIILLVLKFDNHKSDSLGVMIFTSPAPESVEILDRFQRLQWLLKLILQSVHGHYKKVIDTFLILLVLKFHKHMPDSLRVINFTKRLLCSVHCQDKCRKLKCLTWLNIESFFGDYRSYVVLLLSFPKSLGSLFLVI